MGQSPKRSRRDFLRGKAAQDAISHSLDHLPDQADSPSGSTSQSPDAYHLRIERSAMACQFEIILNAAQHKQKTNTAIEAFTLLAELEQQLTIYSDESEMSYINQNAHKEPIRPEKQLFQLLVRAFELYDLTGKAFDITSGPLIKAWGFFERKGALPSKSKLDEAMSKTGFDKIVFDHEQRTVFMTQPGMELNLGAIGKGYALDRMGQFLVGNEIEDFLIHGGRSSLFAKGSSIHAKEGRSGWPVKIGNPLIPGKKIAEIYLHERGLATSGSGVQFFKDGKKKYGHILDPRTGKPAQIHLSITVTAPTAAEADALSTAFYVMKPQEVRDFCELNTDISVLLVRQNETGTRVDIEPIGFGDQEYAIFT